MKLVSWNINGIRPRLSHLHDLIQAFDPDVIALQETKVQDQQFPQQNIKEWGYHFQTIRGQKSYNGVAILSRLPCENSDHLNFHEEDGARHVMARHAGINIHNFYVPAGGDIPDPEQNHKFAHKLRFLDSMTAYASEGHFSKCSILVGDLNIAPSVYDVWSHKQLENVVSHTDIERNALCNLLQTSTMLDVVRYCYPEPEMLFSWWSYRSPDFRKNNRGRRLDHIWISPDLKDNIVSISLIDSFREKIKPSDHIPILLELRD